MGWQVTGDPAQYPTFCIPVSKRYSPARHPLSPLRPLDKKTRKWAKNARQRTKRTRYCGLASPWPARHLHFSNSSHGAAAAKKTTRKRDLEASRPTRTERIPPGGDSHLTPDGAVDYGFHDRRRRWIAAQACPDVRLSCLV
ncbi:hypothetical protein PCL_01941 [Purpureocillium lilacinum]|uniref:Uncharacterized protein n=1 Tax=Purpureocillium lilacinum TaxID=33203 RepID=A0A2U3E111_PURLI|nr:hypothetical protein PCL_01941 [Purpureocillium lilacinum]